RGLASPWRGHRDATTATETDPAPAAGQAQQQREQSPRETQLSGPRDEEDVEHPVDGRGGRGEAEEAAIRLDVGDGDEHGIVGHVRAVDLHLKAREPCAEEKPAAHAPVPEVTQHPILRLPPTALRRFLNVLEQAIRTMRQEELIR